MKEREFHIFQDDFVLKNGLATSLSKHTALIVNGYEIQQVDFQINRLISLNLVKPVDYKINQLIE